MDGLINNEDNHRLQPYNMYCNSDFGHSQAEQNGLICVILTFLELAPRNHISPWLNLRGRQIE